METGLTLSRFGFFICEFWFEVVVELSGFVVDGTALKLAYFGVGFSLLRLFIIVQLLVYHLAQIL